MMKNTILICLEKTNIYVQVGLLYFCYSFFNTLQHYIPKLSCVTLIKNL